MVLHVDHELREEILLVLVYTAEPMIVCHRLYTWDSGDFIGIRNRHQVHQTDAIDDDQPVRTSDLDAAIEGAFYHRQECK